MQGWSALHHSLFSCVRHVWELLAILSFFGWSHLLQILRKQAAFSFEVLCIIMLNETTPCPLQREICITMFSSLHCFAIRVFGFLFEKIRKPCKLKFRQSITKHLISHLFLMTQFFGRGVMLTAVAKIRSSDAVEWNFDLAQPRPLAFTFHLREGPEDDVGRWGWLLRLHEKQAMIPLSAKTNWRSMHRRVYLEFTRARLHQQWHFPNISINRSEIHVDMFFELPVIVVFRSETIDSLKECCLGVALFWRHRHCAMMAFPGTQPWRCFKKTPVWTFWTHFTPSLVGTHNFTWWCVSRP